VPGFPFQENTMNTLACVELLYVEIYVRSLLVSHCIRCTWYTRRCGICSTLDFKYLFSLFEKLFSIILFKC